MTQPFYPEDSIASILALTGFGKTRLGFLLESKNKNVSSPSPLFFLHKIFIRPNDNFCPDIPDERIYDLTFLVDAEKFCLYGIIGKDFHRWFKVISTVEEYNLMA